MASAPQDTPARPEIAVRDRLLRVRGLVVRLLDVLDSVSPVRVLAALVLLQWAVVAAVARTVRHAGWIYYQGGDQLWYYTGGWLLSHGQIGQTPIGYLWSALLAPIALVGGPNLVQSLPAIVILNVAVLLPVAMFALYGIAARIGGRLFGYWAVLLWIVVPVIGIRFTNVGYHQRYTELLLPQSLGLAALADFPTMVAALVSVYYCARVVFDAEPRRFDAVAAGLAAGAAIGIKPATTLFLAGPVLVFAYRRQGRAAALFLAGMAPALIALALWKDKGLGYLPAFNSAGGAARIAAGAHGATPLAALNLSKYFRLDWHHLHETMLALREHFWSARVIEWLVIAGAIGLLRRSLRAGLLVGGWFAAFIVVKGTYDQASVDDASVFRILMPAFPAFILLLASLPLLFPGMPGKLRAWQPAIPSASRRTRWTLAGVAVLVTAVVPIAAIAAASPLRGPNPPAAMLSDVPIPVRVGIGVTAGVSHGNVHLSWRRQTPLGGPVFYRILRLPGTAGGISCSTSQGADVCSLSAPEIGVTHGTSLVDRPKPGRWTYRVAVAANWLNDPAFGDVYFVSPPLTVTTG